MHYPIHQGTLVSRKRANSSRAYTKRERLDDIGAKLLNKTSGQNIVKESVYVNTILELSGH